MCFFSVMLWNHLSDSFLCHWSFRLNQTYTTETFIPCFVQWWGNANMWRNEIFGENRTVIQTVTLPMITSIPGPSVPKTLPCQRMLGAIYCKFIPNFSLYNRRRVSCKTANTHISHLSWLRRDEFIAFFYCTKVIEKHEIIN